MKALILLGGLSSQLPVSTVPKPMAPIQGKPFLAYLVQYLKNHGFRELIFSVHRQWESIHDYFQSYYEGVIIHYAEQTTPLGTGGAITHALSKFHTSEAIFILNGDTFVKINYQAMFEQHVSQGARITMALRSMSDCSQHQKVETKQGKVINFSEEQSTGLGLINAGVYLIQPDLFLNDPLPQQFSFENEFLKPRLKTLQPQFFLAEDYFLDIGVSEDFVRAKLEWAEMGA